MESNQEVQISTNAITLFTDSYEQIKERIEKEQPEFESKSSLVEISTSLNYLIVQIRNNTSKSMIQIPNLLKSLIPLATFRIGSHQREEIDLQRIEVRHWSRQCLSSIRGYGDAQAQSELVNQGFGRVMFITFSKAGGVGEEQDEQIYYGLINFFKFLRDIHDGRNDDWQPSFQPLPLLARRTEEQIEEEGGSEEIDVQLNNKENQWYIIIWANRAKAAIVNHFIHSN
ncbi:MAG: hypothetical protein EZS28_013276 [Streblomastix strix]|uniref:Uncharacterized protein n=1 Tax=Streblomastix strix TaxID=222440 RepID=A0A5J4W966_9EUKA|nr:MAG: hypothetical protein EZS28_013276 [Streblomastix strix]